MMLALKEMLPIFLFIAPVVSIGMLITFFMKGEKARKTCVTLSFHSFVLWMIVFTLNNLPA